MATQTNASIRAPRILVWDGAIRLVHWAIALLFGFSWYTHRTHLDWHRYSGYTLLTLVLFRIYWGFAGSTTARFRSFVQGPRGIAHYVRTLPGHGAKIVGHNPLGALSVLLLLGLLLAQCVIGLFVTDTDGLESGPLSAVVSFDTSRLLAEWHGQLFTALKIVVALHVAAVLLYLTVKRDNLIGPMVTGKKHFDGEVRPLHFSGWKHALIALVVIAAVVWGILKFG